MYHTHINRRLQYQPKGRPIPLVKIFFLDAPRPLCLETMLRACLYSIKVDVKSLHILYLFNLCCMHNIDKLIILINRVFSILDSIITFFRRRCEERKSSMAVCHGVSVPGSTSVLYSVFNFLHLCEMLSVLEENFQKSGPQTKTYRSR